MNSISKVVIGLMSCVMILCIMTARTTTVTNDWVEDELAYALRVASQDATSVLMDENHSLDGNTIDAENISVDLDRALGQFEESFSRNVGSHLNPDAISNMNIPLVGYVGYRFVFGHTYDGGSTFPYAYTCVKNGVMYNFTLNDDTVYVTVGNGDEEEKKISDYPENFFSSVMTNEEFRTYTVMSAISNFLTIYNGADVSLVAQNMGTSIQFELGRSDFANGDPAIMTDFAAVIDGPGFFAITDMMDPQISGIPVRTFTFGGSELLSKY